MYQNLELFLKGPGGANELGQTSPNCIWLTCVGLDTFRQSGNAAPAQLIERRFRK